MITQSDNHAASVLWAEVGRHAPQHLLDLAKMRATHLGPGGFWGVTDHLA